LEKTVLETKVDASIVDRLYRDGLLNDEAYQAAREKLLPTPDWYPWTRRMLLFLGSALVLAGIIFFFAYNWAVMHKFLKFGLIEAGIIACVVTAYIRDISKLSSKVLILSASVLVGVLLAVFGQTYQTGADAYELFTGWAILIIGWVLISEFSALWFIWLVIVNTGMILYWQQVGQPAYSIDYQWLYLILAGVNGIALILYEFGTFIKTAWLGKGWLRVILFAAVLVYLTFPVIDIIFNYDRFLWSNNIDVLLWICCLVSGFWFYRHKFKSISQLALISLNICIVVLTLIGRIILEEYWREPEIKLLLFSLIVLVIFAGAGYWLKYMGRTMSSEVEGGNHE
jgi:uncharacterized membrane protein